MSTLEELTEVSRKLPESAQREVLEFARSLEQGLSSGCLMDYVGRLAKSSNFNEDPVKLQKALRDEWR
jgi:hypothetical protein